VNDTPDEALDRDIRLLGRLLGDVIAEQAGASVFDLVETLRRESVGARRDGGKASRRIDPLVTGMTQDSAIYVTRAFSWFSLLANIAEDVHHARRQRFHRAWCTRPRVQARWCIRWKCCAMQASMTTASWTR
jgi:phosphoenolpyruvate carboxylase